MPSYSMNEVPVVRPLQLTLTNDDVVIINPSRWVYLGKETGTTKHCKLYLDDGTVLDVVGTQKDLGMALTGLAMTLVPKWCPGKP